MCDISMERKNVQLFSQNHAWIRLPLRGFLALLVSSGFAFPCALAFGAFAFTIFAFPIFSFSITLSTTHRRSAVWENLEFVLISRCML